MSDDDDRRLLLDRSKAKQDARDEDRRRIEAGEVSGREIARRNDFFSAVDLSNFEIESIGGRPLR